MKEVNGFKYSREQFVDYLFRAKIRLITGKGQLDYHNLDIYTTDTDKNSLLRFIDTVKSEKVAEVQLLNWVTKEQDDNATELLKDMKW